MKLSVIYAVATTDGSTYLASNGNNYYVKGCYSSEPTKFDNIEDALASYVGVLTNIIVTHGVGCEVPL